ncbi:MAG: class I adenylate-forming enzyme family protein, partial [Bacteroidota bacterium]
FIRFTSGTTGSSKGVMLSHQTVEDRVYCANTALKIKPGDRVLCVLSMAYHFVVSIILYLRNGACIVVSKGINASQMLADIGKHHITFIYAAPMQIKLLSGDMGKQNMPSVRLVISTSASIGRELCDRFFARYGIAVSQAYGIIELGLPIVNDNGEDPESVGRCVDGFKAAILDEHAQPLSIGKLGELGLKGPGMLDAYLSPYKKREEILVNGWFLTGDLALMDEEGRIKIAGRKKTVINVSGNKVFPEEVEAVIEEIPQVKCCKVKGVPHVLTGELVQAEVVLKTGFHPPDQEEMIRFCRKHLSAYKVPQRILFVDQLETTGSGKTKRT